MMRLNTTIQLACVFCRRCLTNLGNAAHQSPHGTALTFQEKTACSNKNICELVSFASSQESNVGYSPPCIRIRDVIFNNIDNKNLFFPDCLNSQRYRLGICVILFSASVFGSLLGDEKRIGLHLNL